jgi:hypothetical protein
MYVRDLLITEQDFCFIYIIFYDRPRDFCFQTSRCVCSSYISTTDRTMSMKGRKYFYYAITIGEEVTASLGNNDGLRFIKNSNLDDMVATSIH